MMNLIRGLSIGLQFLQSSLNSLHQLILILPESHVDLSHIVTWFLQFVSIVAALTDALVNIVNLAFSDSSAGFCSMRVDTRDVVRYQYGFVVPLFSHALVLH
jgi:hypothetical protein